MTEKPEDVAEELEDAGSSEIDDTVLEDVSGGVARPEEEINNNNNGSC